MRVFILIMSGVLSCFFCMAIPVMALEVQNHTNDPYLYMKVYGDTDYLYAEALHGGFFDYQGVYRVSHSAADEELNTEPVEFSMNQVSAGAWFKPSGYIIIHLNKGETFDYWSWIFRNFSYSLGISYIEIRVTSFGDTITAGFNSGSHIVSTNADNTTITITSSVPGTFLNPWNGSLYPPVGNIPDFTFSDHSFSFVIKIGISSPTQDWIEQLYTEGVTISKPFLSTDLGIPDVFSVGITSATIREGIILDASAVTLEAGQTYITLPAFFPLSELNTAQVDLQSLRLYRHDESQGKWILGGREGNNNSSSGMFVSGLPTDVLGDFGVHVDESQNIVLVWANIDNLSNYSVGATISSSKKHSWNLFLPSIIKERQMN